MSRLPNPKDPAHMMANPRNEVESRHARQRGVMKSMTKETGAGLESRAPRQPAERSATTQARPDEYPARRAADAAWAASEAHFRTLADNALVGIFTSDRDGRLLYANEALACLFGYETREEFIAGGVISRYKDPADRARLIAGLEANGRVDSFEVELVDRSGNTITAILCARMDRNRISGVLTDITARKAVETALHESEERYRLLLEGNPDAVFCHRQGIIILANPAAVDLFGALSAEGLIGRDFYSLVHPDDVAQLKKRRDRVVATGETVPLLAARFLQIDGRVIDVEVGGALVLLDNQPTVQTVARDISARVQAEAERERLIAELKKALAKVRTLKDLLPICAQCKKIRDDHGYWNQIELYFREHTDLTFSHGLCPDCARELFPGWES
jgi:PAS domain S-box-containing protein